jgi:hypothetical protein
MTITTSEGVHIPHPKLIWAIRRRQQQQQRHSNSQNTLTIPLTSLNHGIVWTPTVQVASLCVAQEEPTEPPPPPPPLKRHKGLSAEKNAKKLWPQGMYLDIFSSRVRRDAEYGFQFPHIPLWRNHVAILDFAESAIWSTQVMSRRCLVRNTNLVGEILRFRRVVESDLKTRRFYSFIWGKEPSFTDLSEHRSARTAVLKATVFRWLEVQKIKNGSAIPVGWIPWQLLENSFVTVGGCRSQRVVGCGFNPRISDSWSETPHGQPFFRRLLDWFPHFLPWNFCTKTCKTCGFQTFLWRFELENQLYLGIFQHAMFK